MTELGDSPLHQIPDGLLINSQHFGDLGIAEILVKPKHHDLVLAYGQAFEPKVQLALLLLKLLRFDDFTLFARGNRVQALVEKIPTFFQIAGGRAVNTAAQGPEQIKTGGFGIGQPVAALPEIDKQVLYQVPYYLLIGYQLFTVAVKHPHVLLIQQGERLFIAILKALPQDLIVGIGKGRTQIVRFFGIGQKY